jgi:DNA-binding transcriptional MerR regulator
VSVCLETFVVTKQISMAIYSIRDLEKLTGIKAHTIRIWEQRYGLVTPARTDTNIRYYTDENLRLLFNIALLNRNGLKISKLAQMSSEEIAAKGAAIAQNNPNPNSQIDALTLGMIDLSEEAFERVFVEYVSTHGFLFSICCVQGACVWLIWVQMLQWLTLKMPVIRLSRILFLPFYRSPYRVILFRPT